MASLSQNRSRPILRWRRLLKIPGVQFRDAGNVSKFVLNFAMPPSSRNRPRSIVRSRGLLQIGGLQFQHGMFSSMHSSKSSRTHVLRRARQHKARCTHVLRHTTQHQAHARMFSRVHVSTSLMHAYPPDQIARRNTRNRSRGLTPLSHSRNSRGVVRHSTLALARSRSFDQIGNPPVAHFTLVQHRR